MSHQRKVVKQETKELTQNFHGNTSNLSKHGNDIAESSFETKDSERVPPTLEAAAPLQLPLPHGSSESFDAPKPQSLKPTSKPFVYQDDDATIGNDKPVVAEKDDLSKVSESSCDDSLQLSIGKSCIVHSDKLFDTVCLVPTENYLVVKDVEIVPGLYRRRLELQYRDGCTNLDVAGGATYFTGPQAVASLVKERKHFRCNENKTGYIIFTSNVRFWGNYQYRLPNRNVEACRIGKKGCVFLMFHFRRPYAVKKTVYRPKEIDIHSQLCHPNIINLEAVLVGGKHERDKDQLYVYHFMLKMDMSFADVLSTMEDGCLKCLKIQLIEKEVLWKLVLVNVRHVLKSVLAALKYMHSRKLVHRDIKASKILITKRCGCNDLLFCTCCEQQKPVVKLGDFSSSSDVTGWESRFITANDIWSFGYFLISIFLGKHRPLRLTTTEQLLMEAKRYYGDNPALYDLMHKCLQVHAYCRPTAEELLTLDFFTKPLYAGPLYVYVITKCTSFVLNNLHC